MKKYLTILVLMLLTFVLVTQAFADQIETGYLLDIQGDDLFIDTEKQHVEFTGNVLALYQDYQIKSDKIFYDISAEKLEVTGAVQLNGNELSGSADKILIDINADLITFTGDVHVNWKGQLIRGAVITFDLKTSILKATDASVKIIETGDKE